MAGYINLIIGVFIPIAIGFVCLYLNGRIKNLATKHDVADLTRITEEVKKEFTDNTEQLKAQLSLNNQHRLNIKNVEILALIDYNKKNN